MSPADEPIPEWATLLNVPWPATVVEAAGAAAAAFDSPTERSMVGLANLFERMPALRGQIVALAMERRPDPEIAYPLAQAMLRFADDPIHVGLGASIAIAVRRWDVASQALGRSEQLDTQIATYAARIAPREQVYRWLSDTLGDKRANDVLSRAVPA